MMFDHGCDAFSVGFMVTMIARILALEDTAMLFLFI